MVLGINASGAVSAVIVDFGKNATFKKQESIISLLSKLMSTDYYPQRAPDVRTGQCKQCISSGRIIEICMKNGLIVDDLKIVNKCLSLISFNTKDNLK